MPSTITLVALNKVRNDFFLKSHDLDHRDAYPKPPERSNLERVSYWIGHKALSVVAFPANACVVALASVGIATVSLPIAALKVAIFAGSVGNVKPTFSTGTLWFGERLFSSGFQLARNVGELTYDVANLTYNAALTLRSVLTALKLDCVFNQIKNAVAALSNRVITGLDLALRDEVASLPQSSDDVYNQCWRTSCFNSERPDGTWLIHKLLSIKAIPQASLTMLVHSATCLVGVTAIAAKVALYTVSGTHISTPTHATENGSEAFHAGLQVMYISAQVAADAALGIYNIAKWTGLARVVATARDVLWYIPQAVLT